MLLEHVVGAEQQRRRRPNVLQDLGDHPRVLDVRDRAPSAHPVFSFTRTRPSRVRPRRSSTTGNDVTLPRLHFYGQNQTIHGAFIGTAGEFGALLRVFAAGRFKPVVDAVVPLAEGRRGPPQDGARRPLRQDRPHGPVKFSGPIDLAGQVALVTGASRGIGRAIAVALAREGADVVAADIIPVDETVAAVRALGRRGLAIRADVSRKASVERMLTAVGKGLGGPDILVNNAGITHRDRLEDTTERTWDRVVDVILKGCFLCCQATLPGMRRRGYGKIVNIASISGIIGGAVSRKSDRPRDTRSRTGPAYAAAKGGVIALTKWVAKDAGADGIYVNAVAPGPIETEMTRGFSYPVDRLPIARMGTPEDIAEAVVFLASPASNYITGQVLCVDGGWVM